jgi:bifunctional ADP-heptose synthase (sugar kinase/adenylyltransferase)
VTAGGASAGPRLAAAKRVSLESAAADARAWRAHGETVALSRGVFDGLDPVHVDRLAAARAGAARLVVAVACDDAARAVLGTAPVLAFEHRATLVAGLRIVDRVVACEPGAFDGIVAAIAPDVPVSEPAPEEERKLPERVLARHARR